MNNPTIDYIVTRVDIVASWEYGLVFLEASSDRAKVALAARPSKEFSYPNCIKLEHAAALALMAELQETQQFTFADEEGGRFVIKEAEGE